MTWLLIDPLCVYRLRKELNQALEEMEDIQRDLMKQVGSNQQFESQLPGCYRQEQASADWGMDARLF